MPVSGKSRRSSIRSPSGRARSRPRSGCSRAGCSAARSARSKQPSSIIGRSRPSPSSKAPGPSSDRWRRTSNGARIWSRTSCREPRAGAYIGSFDLQTNFTSTWEQPGAARQLAVAWRWLTATQFQRARGGITSLKASKLFQAGSGGATPSAGKNLDSSLVCRLGI